MIDRRRFLVSSAGFGLAAVSGRQALGIAADTSARLQVASQNVASTRQTRKKVAFIGTWIKTHSHAQHFLDRLTDGYAWQGAWQQPRIDVASVYIDQFPEGDLARERIAKQKLQSFTNVKDALTLGTGKLAVDGVVIIGEHGNYPKNEKGQTLYPRYKWFKECVNLFEASGQSVPIFNDKHLSTDWDECVEMVTDASRLKIPFLAGSSLPVTWRHPSIELPHGADLSESVCVAYGGIDSYDIHALETAQCMSERRRGGEAGVARVQAVRDENVWKLLESSERKVTRQLFVSALCRSHNLPVETGYPSAPVTYAWAKSVFDKIVAYHVEHVDGFRTTIFLTGIRDFNYAGHLKDTGDVVSCQMYLPMPGHGSTTADFFNPLTRHIEDTIITGQVPYPVERTLLTSGIVIAGVESLYAGQAVIETPHLNVSYKAAENSAFWRD